MAAGAAVVCISAWHDHNGNRNWLMAAVVPADGPLDADIVVVGRDPGWQEVRDGCPMVGASGKILNEALLSAGLHRKDILVTNVCQVRPPGDDWDKHAEDDVKL